MTDQEVIQEFYAQISWADQCRTVTESGRTLLVTPCALAVPSHWQDYKQNKAFVLPIAKSYSLDPQLLVWGAPSKAEVEKIWWDSITSSQPRIYAKFLDVEASLVESDLILKVLEGLDVHKTFENFLAGNSQVVFDWENHD
ncbi:hypothetical protein IQ243_29240 [Nostocales cyanobacterium LEGE 11386]|nr:hypothetical protein [Nostocales cyanobacterium LEGE 11386]